ncbi:MAG: HD domain-containing protein [Deltaproteobacteria bacterium]|nr:HD domain-containing protein [Deltaproteobacteria bacterium]
MTRAKVMIVEDEFVVAKDIQVSLEGLNYTVPAIVSSGENAVARAAEETPDLILMDIMLHGDVDGIEAARKIRSRMDIPVVYLTAYTDDEILERAQVTEPYGYIVKPFKNRELHSVIQMALHKHTMEKRATESRARQRHSAEAKRTEKELQEALEKLRKIVGNMIQTIALTIEKRDPYTAGHQKRVANIARSIGTEMGLAEEQIDGIRMAGLIHDIGKIAVPAEILSKPFCLTTLEYEMIKTHVDIGYDILKSVDFPFPIAAIILQHHERIDGSGYPRALSNHDILLEAKILAVADVVEAIASHRPYRPSLGLEMALEEIMVKRKSAYDADVVDACLRVLTKNKDYLR